MKSQQIEVLEIVFGVGEKPLGQVQKILTDLPFFLGWRMLQKKYRNTISNTVAVTKISANNSTNFMVRASTDLNYLRSVLEICF